MSLPSSFALCANAGVTVNVGAEVKNYKLNAQVYLDEDGLNTAMDKLVKEIMKKMGEIDININAFINEEKDRLRINLKDAVKGNLRATLDGAVKEGYDHFMVLVNGGAHWVAVKHDSSSSSSSSPVFSVYDPAGAYKGFDSVSEKYSGLVIAFRN
jgi:hypothetical protein